MRRLKTCTSMTIIFVICVSIAKKAIFTIIKERNNMNGIKKINTIFFLPNINMTIETPKLKNFFKKGILFLKLCKTYKNILYTVLISCFYFATKKILFFGVHSSMTFFKYIDENAPNLPFYPSQVT